jgi:predicted metal-binding protein
MPNLIQSQPTPWTTVILLCGKCAGKMKAGYGQKGTETLRATLKAELKVQGRRRGVRVIETRCMGLCPRKAIAALNASRPGRILAIPKGASTDDALIQLLEPVRQPPAPAAVS